MEYSNSYATRKGGVWRYVGHETASAEGVRQGGRQKNSKQTTIRSQILPRNDLEGMGEIRLNAAFIGTYFEIV